MSLQKFKDKAQDYWCLLVEYTWCEWFGHKYTHDEAHTWCQRCLVLYPYWPDTLFREGSDA